MSSDVNSEVKVMRYRCKVCGTVAEIDKERKTMTIEPPAPKIPSPRPDMELVIFSQKFPIHLDCELAKSVDEVDLDLLEPVEEGHQFATEKGGFQDELGYRHP